MAQQDEKVDIRWSASGRADRYITAEGEVRPLKDEPLPFALFMAVSVAGIVLAASQVRGNWWLQTLGTVVAMVGVVGTVPYRWRTVYWDLVVVSVAVLCFVIHVKISLGG